MTNLFSLSFNEKNVSVYLLVLHGSWVIVENNL